MAAAVRYRQSYVEKDRCVRNSTAAPVPGVDILQGFTLSKSEFEHVFLQAAETMDDRTRLSSAESEAMTSMTKGKQSSTASTTPSRIGRSRRKNTSNATNNTTTTTTSVQKQQQQNHDDSSVLTTPEKRRNTDDNDYNNNKVMTVSQEQRGFRSPPNKVPDPTLTTPEDAADYADVCRKHAASLQRSSPPDYDGAGEFFEKACDARATHGLFCSPDNADAHVEYAQNLSKRGLTPEAEYHLRTAADIYRMMNARSARKYGDVLLYLAVVIDRQARLAEAENFYRSSLAVYRANKLSDDNVRVAIDSLSNNLRAQGRGNEVDSVVRRHFLGAFD